MTGGEQRVTSLPHPMPMKKLTLHGCLLQVQGRGHSPGVEQPALMAKGKDESQVSGCGYDTPAQNGTLRFSSQFTDGRKLSYCLSVG